ncbi:MAG: LysR substrate-binding domain-containing protein [Leptospirales bacterium]|jgi:LysR family hydrogen peroxide-inducible transcriptional activator
MTLTQLRYIVAVDRYGGFAPAAKHCLVTQPTLSLQIQKIEQEIGAEIFDRRKNPVKATHHGRRVIEQAKNVLREADKIEELFREDEDEPSGEITLGIIPTVAPVLMPALYATLGKKYKGLRFRIFELPTTQIIEKMRADEIELGILATPLGYKDIVEIPLYYESFVAYFPKDYDGPQSGLDPHTERPGGYEMILLGEDHCFRDQSLRVCGNRNTSRIECGSLETLMKMVDRGAGMTLLPQLAVAGTKKNDKKNKRVARFREPQPSREISLVHHRDFYKKRIFDAIREIVLAQIPQELREKKGRQLLGVDVDSDP